MGALFEPAGDGWLPTDLARGPWSPDALHGGPVAALLARAVEGCEPTPTAEVVRLTVDLLRPVPVAPLHPAARLARAGRSVQHLDATVATADGVEVARARAVRIRTLASPPPPLSGPSSAPVPGGPGAPARPEAGATGPSLVQGYPAFHNCGAELRFVDGGWGSLGRSSVWVRLAAAVVPGEEPSPLQRVAAAADFGNGVSAVVPMQEHVFINPDLTVYLERPAAGEWVCLEAVTRLGSPGIGLAQSLLWDERGVIGRALQSLVIEARSGGGAATPPGPAPR
ncbi:MAG: thioesterase family protein [Acidimicrobiales bacterium]